MPFPSGEHLRRNAGSAKILDRLLASGSREIGDPDFGNVYEDEVRADAYSRLEFPGTYYLAYRDLPAILHAHVTSGRALDFGCGAGRSTRFLKTPWLRCRRRGHFGGHDPKGPCDRSRGDYRLAQAAVVEGLAEDSCDVVLSAFTFDNVPQEMKVPTLSGLVRLLSPGGRMVNLVSNPEIYTHEWASFSTRDFPENREAKCGDVVRIVMTDVRAARPVEDIVCSKACYLEIYNRSRTGSRSLLRAARSRGRTHCVDQRARIARWRIDVLMRTETGSGQHKMARVP